MLAIILAVCATVDNKPMRVRTSSTMDLQKKWICFATLPIPIEISDFKEAMISGLTECRTTIMMDHDGSLYSIVLCQTLFGRALLWLGVSC